MQNEMTVLELLLHGQMVGHLTGFRDGRNVLSFADSFRANPARPTFSLITHPNFPNSDKLMRQPWARNQRLHPVLSNLLPEGEPRELLSRSLKIHIDNEFKIFSYSALDLPGALVARPIQADFLFKD